jgi:hypothetical protein
MTRITDSPPTIGQRLPSTLPDPAQVSPIKLANAKPFPVALVGDEDDPEYSRILADPSGLRAGTDLLAAVSAAAQVAANSDENSMLAVMQAKNGAYLLFPASDSHFAADLRRDRFWRFTPKLHALVGADGWVNFTEKRATS